MIAYKGFTKQLTARLGRGSFQFSQGETFKEENSKTVRSGFHCCENPFACLGYYHFGSGDRFFQVEAAGNIDEDDNERIACTEITLLKELSVKEFAGHGMMYMVQHPQRDNWQQRTSMCNVAEDRAETNSPSAIVIARGKAPRVKGVVGSILGLILEEEPGKITAAKLFVVGEDNAILANTWYTLKDDRTLSEVKDEEESN